MHAKVEKKRKKERKSGDHVLCLKAAQWDEAVKPNYTIYASRSTNRLCGAWSPRKCLEEDGQSASVVSLHFNASALNPRQWCHFFHPWFSLVRELNWHGFLKLWLKGRSDAPDNQLRWNYDPDIKDLRRKWSHFGDEIKWGCWEVECWAFLCCMWC